MRRIVVLMGGLALATSAPAQEARPPALLVKGEDGSSAPLQVDDVRVTVKVIGNVAETIMTLRFRNDTDRVLEGELVFPLGEGRTVSRYALEIDGRMRSGVSIPKNRGRAVFESVVRRQIDPGLLEWTKGNNFRTRIYPIPPKGTKSVEVGYEEELAEDGDDYVYRLPLAFDEPLDRFRLAIESTRPVKELLAHVGPSDGIPLRPRESEPRIVETDLEEFDAHEALEVRIPRQNQSPVAVEQWRGQHYFYLLDRPAVPAQEPERTKPNSVHLIWDASESGRERHVAKELELLDRYVRWLGEATVTLTWLRNDLEDGGTFAVKAGNCPALWNALTTVRYDGATRLELLDFQNETSEAILLVSDGVATLGESELKAARVPVFALHGSESAAHGLLRSAAAESGGAYVNLADDGVDGGFAALTRHRFSLLSAELKNGREIYPATPQPVDGAIGIAGQLASGQPVRLTLNYGWGDEVKQVRQIEIDPAKHRSELGRVPRLWAQKKLEALKLAPARNRDEIESLAGEHGLVTRFTSLIVLDRIEDYVEFRIVPPDPEMHDQYLRLLRDAPDPDQPDPDHLDEMLAHWKERCEWHDTEFPGLPEIVIARMDSLRPQLAELREHVAKLPAPKSEEEQQKAQEVRAILATFAAHDQRLTALRAVPENRRDARWQRQRGQLADELQETVQGWQQRLGRGQTWGGGGAVAGGIVMSAADGASPSPEPAPFVPEASADPFSDDGDPSTASADPFGDADPFSAEPAPAGSAEFRTRRVEADLAGLRAGDSAVARDSLDGVLNSPARSGRDAELDPDGNYEPPELPNAVGATGGLSARAPSPEFDWNTLHALLTATEADEDGGFPVTPATPASSGSAPERPTPYLDALRTAPDGADLEAIYFSWKARNEFRTTPAFYLDASDFFFEHGRREIALRVLSNVAELHAENISFLRIVAHRFAQVGALAEAELLFREVLQLRDDEPQSWRDLALVCERRDNFQEAAEKLWRVVANEWDSRFPAIQMVALTELNALVARHGESLDLSSIDERFLRNIDCDLRVVLTWDADNTDVDLWVTGPAGERCFYGHDRTRSGGRLSEDFTDGYGPEEFLIRRALPGRSAIAANYFGNRRQTLAGATTIQATVFRNWGRPGQQRRAVTLRLENEEDIIKIGTEQFEPE